MEEKKLIVRGILLDGVKTVPKGLFIPDTILSIVIDRGLDACLKKQWMLLDPISRCLSAEYDFTAEDVSNLIKHIDPRLRAEAGVELLRPDQPFPQAAYDEVASSADEEVELESESYDDKITMIEEDDVPVETASSRPAKDPARIDDLEWKPNPASFSDTPTPPPMKLDMEIVRLIDKQNVKADEIKSAPTLEAAITTAAAQRATPPPTATPKNRGRYVYTIGKDESRSLLFSIMRGSTGVDPALWHIANNAVLKTDIEKGIISNSLDNSPTARLMRDALALQFSLECDYAIYSGARKIDGLVMSAAIGQSRALITEVDETLKLLTTEAAKPTKTPGNYDSDLIKQLAANLDDSRARLQEVVSALSHIPESDNRSQPQKFDKTVETAKKKSEKKTVKERAEKSDGKSQFAIAAALVLMLAVLLGTGFYLKGLFTAPPNVAVDPARYNEIILLTDAKLSSNSFVGVVDDSYWSGLSAEEKSSRATMLYQTVKTDRVQGMLLLGADNHRIAQTYGDTVKIF